MDSPKSYKVAIRQKVPFLTNFFLGIAMVFFLIIILFNFLFYPLRSAPDEIKAAVFFFVVPEFWKKVLTLSAIGFCMSTLLFFYLRYYKTAILKFYKNEIILRGKTIRLTIPVAAIRKIYCNDATTNAGLLKEELSITIEQKKTKATAIKLKNYSEADDFMEELMKYENLNITFFDFKNMPTLMEEE